MFYQIAAALGEMGPDARDAVPIILEAVKDGIDPIFGPGLPGRKIPFEGEPLAALAKIDPDLASIADAVPKLRQYDPGRSRQTLGTLILGLRHEKIQARELAAFGLGLRLLEVALPGPPIPPLRPGVSPRELAIKELTQALKDESQGVRWSAATSLVRIGEWHSKEAEALNRLALPALIDALSRDKKHSRVRAWAAYALGRIGARSQRQLGAEVLAAAPVLLDALNDPDNHVQWQAMFALAGVSKRPEHVQAVVRNAIETLQGKKPFHHDPFLPNLDVLELLGRIGPEAAAAFPLVLARLKDTEAAVAHAEPPSHGRSPTSGQSAVATSHARSKTHQPRLGNLKSKI